MSQEWNIRIRGDCCAATGNGFADGTVIVSRLVFGEDGYRREDYAEAQWDETLREGAVSVWRGVFRAPPPTPQEAIRKETVESLLRELIETDDEANRGLIFILAVMLERKRILVERDVHQRDDGMRMRVYEHRKSGESFLIPDPELQLDELDALQVHVMERLGIPYPGGGIADSGEVNSEQ
jgi:hypothetical protein